MKLEEKVVKLLNEKGLKLTTAESCTGGLIAKRITDVSGASNVFECTVVSYSNRIKHDVLGVSEETLEKFGAVSEECAKEMVEGIRRFAKADVAIAVTGMAGPTSDEADKPVGLIFVGYADKNKTVVKKFLNSFSDDIRNQNRIKTADDAFELILENLQ